MRIFTASVIIAALSLGTPAFVQAQGAPSQSEAQTPPAEASTVIRSIQCQSACKFDPVSASNFDPFERRVLTVALVSSELAGIAETKRARVA
jgi:hypothetical protein